MDGGQQALPGVVTETLARGLGWADSVRTPQARAALRAGLWRDAWDLSDGADLVAAVRWVTDAQARAELAGRPWPEREIAELRALVREVARRVRSLREVLGG